MTEPSYDITPAPLPPEEDTPVEEAPEEEVTPDYMTAFLIVTRLDGSSFATNDMQTAITMVRDATLGDMHRATLEVLDDLRTTATSQNVMAMLMQQGEAARKAAEQEGMRKALAKKGINVPAGGLHKL